MIRFPKENPADLSSNQTKFLSVLSGLLSIASAIDEQTPAKPGNTPASRPADETPMPKFKAIEDKARTDLYALMDDCFYNGYSVFFSDCPDGLCWNEADHKYKGTPHTVAIVKDALDRDHIGISVLSAPDVFSAVVGRVIALRRAMDKPVPKEYYTAGSLLAKSRTLPVRKGDTIRIKYDHANCADVKAGDLLTVKRVGSLAGDVETEEGASSFGIGWRFHPENFEVVKPVEPDKPTAPAFKVGDTVRVISTTKHPTDTSLAIVGKKYKIMGIQKDCIQLDIGTCPWVNCADVELTNEETALAPGKYVRLTGKDTPLSSSSYAKVGYIYRIAAISESGNPKLDIPASPYVSKRDVEIVRFVKRPAKVGDVVRIAHDTANGAPVRAGDFYMVAALSMVNPTRIITGKPLGDGNPDGWFIEKENYEVVEAVDAPQPPAEKWVRKPANVGDTIRITKQYANGANIQVGDRFTVRATEHFYGYVQVPRAGTSRAVWGISAENYEVLDV